MASQELSHSYSALPVRPPLAFEQAKVRNWGRVWLHCLLFVVTLATTTTVGSRMQYNFDHDLPFFDVFQDLSAIWFSLQHPSLLLPGLPFSLTLLIILLAHEFGHYVACLYYGVDASLPFFLPAPTFTGTFGAFIRIRAAIYSKRALFDVGIAGPIAGFVFLLPAITVGLALSKVVPNIALTGSMRFGTPVLLRLFEMIIFPGVPVSDIYLHPMVRAAWVALFATALNLLPVGQLDGGHIVYALFGERHRIVTRAALLGLVIVGLIYWDMWLVWALLLFLFGRKHPSIFDTQPLGRARLQLALLALAIFALCFSVTPVSQ